MPWDALTAGDIADLRTVVAEFQPETVTITDPATIVVESDGGTSIAGSVSVATTGLLESSGTQAVINEFGAQIAAEADYILVMPHDTTIREGWTLAVNGQEYTVIAVNKPMSWQAMIRAAIVSSTPIGG